MGCVSEYPDDISPYATFHVAGAERPSPSPTNMQSFVYHDHRLAAMETMPLKSVSTYISTGIFQLLYC